MWRAATRVVRIPYFADSASRQQLASQPMREIRPGFSVVAAFIALVEKRAVGGYL